MKPLNQAALRAIELVSNAGYVTEAQISSLTLDDVLKMDIKKTQDMIYINELQKAVKANNLLRFICGVQDTGSAATESKPNKESDKGGEQSND